MIAAILLCILSGCKKLFQYHPSEVRVAEQYSNLNAQNVQRLSNSASTANLKFAVVGDSQRFYDELHAFVNFINQTPDISFVVINGDITDFGTNKEFKWIADELSRLSVPFFVVIGNHDMLANGRILYQKMFGPENFSFQYAGKKFIFLNSNSRETGFDGSLPDLGWLENELNFNGEIFVFAHIPPFNLDFDQTKASRYNQLMAQAQVEYSIHGHEHSYFFGQPYGPPVDYLVVGSLSSRDIVLLNVTNDSIQIEKTHF